MVEEAKPWLKLAKCLVSPSSKSNRTMKTVMTSTFTVRTDIPYSSAKTHPSGVLHASQPDIVDLRQKHVFVWISDLNFIQSAVDHFLKLHYNEENLVFIPFSSKKNWLKSYPYAIPSLDCDDRGNIVFCQPTASAAPDTDKSQITVAVAQASTSHFTKKKEVAQEYQSQLY
jgi:hypothetical protein